MSEEKNGILDPSTQEMVAEIAKEQAQEEEQTQQPPENPRQEFDVDKAAEQFDVTRKARQDAFNHVEKVLSRASRGFKLDRKEITKVLSNLWMVNKTHDMLLIAIMGDMMRTVRATAENEGGVINLEAKIRTLATALNDYDVLSEEQIEKTHREKTYPALKQQLEQAQGQPQDDDDDLD